MANQQLYNKPVPKLPAFANTDIRDFNAPEIAPLKTVGVTPKAAPGFAALTQPSASVARTGRTNQLIGGIKKALPYASNIGNMFSKPPLPPAPTYLEPVSFQRVNYNADRAAADQQLRGIDVAAERNLDGRNAVTAKIGGYTQRMRALSEISGREQNANTEIANRETMYNAQIDARNAGAKDQFNRDTVERSVALSSARSANLADLTDKMVGTGNQEALRQLDKDKLKVLSRMSPDVWRRLVTKLKADGYDVEGK